MQETEMHHALKEYATDGEPVMRLTADAVLTAGRKSRRTRQLAGFAGAGMAAALVGAGVVVVANGGFSTGDRAGGIDFAAASPCPRPAGSRPPAVIAADRPLSPEVLQWATTSVTCYLNQEVPRLLPSATYAQMPGAQGGPLTGFSLGGEPPYGNRVDSMTLISDAEGTGDLTVTVSVVDPSEATRQKAGCRSETAAKCTVQRGPDGETVLVSTERDPLPADSPRNYVVRVYRGHSEIYVQVSNTDRQSVNGAAPVPTRPTPILSADQAIQMALSPELYLFP
jgi:hypothetical protein